MDALLQRVRRLRLAQRSSHQQNIMEVLSEAPKTGSFIPLAEHQSATPASFYTGPPVLHYYSDRCKIVVLENELASSSALSNLVSKASTSATNGSHETNGHSDNYDDQSSSQKTIENVDIWVTSDKLLLYSTGLSTGLSIAYPTISLHAIQSLPHPSALDASSQGLYMQLISAPTATSDEEEEPDTISMTIIPTASGVPASVASATGEHVDAALESEDQPEEAPVQALFNALSNCSNLHPDPADDDDEMGQEQGLEGSMLYQAGLVMPGAQGDGLPPPMPGSGGWITAENMHEFLDAEGNWIGPDEDSEMIDGEDAAEGDGSGLGPGAGTVRQRDGGADEAGNEDDTKWRRTE